MSSMPSSCSGVVYSLEPAPVGVRALRDDLALLHQPLEHALHVEALGLLARRPPPRGAEAEREVLEVYEDGEAMCIVSHGCTSYLSEQVIVVPGPPAGAPCRPLTATASSTIIQARHLACAALVHAARRLVRAAGGTPGR